MAMRAPSDGPSASREQDSRLLREMFGVLLDVRASVEANGAALERLDARVAALERHAARGAALAAGVRGFEPGPTLLELSADALEKVATFIEPDDALATSLACRKLRDAIRGGVGAARGSARPRGALSTRVRSLLGSLGKLRWGVACGAPLSKELVLHAAKDGDLRMLCWLRERGCAWPDEAAPGRLHI